MGSELEAKLRELLNMESREQESDTPDFILATYMHSCLEAFELATNQRDSFYKVDHGANDGV